MFSHGIVSSARARHGGGGGVFGHRAVERLRRGVNCLVNSLEAFVSHTSVDGTLHSVHFMTKHSCTKHQFYQSDKYTGLLFNSEEPRNSVFICVVHVRANINV